MKRSVKWRWPLVEKMGLEREHEQQQKRRAQEEEQHLMPLDAAREFVLRGPQPPQAAEGHRAHALGLQQMDDDRDGQQRSGGKSDGGEEGEHGWRSVSCLLHGGVWARPKAVLKTPQSRRWRDQAAASEGAKRLDCGGFSAAVPRDARL